jgi:hypothetical protein
MKTGVLLDVETTGLDPRKDEVIELGMVKFNYLPGGRIAGLKDVFTSFNEPTVPISTEVRNAGARRPARAGAEEDGARVGRAVAFRSEGFVEASGIPVERRQRRPTAILVC